MTVPPRLRRRILGALIVGGAALALFVALRPEERSILRITPIAPDEAIFHRALRGRSLSRRRVEKRVRVVDTDAGTIVGAHRTDVIMFDAVATAERCDRRGVTCTRRTSASASAGSRGARARAPATSASRSSI